MTDNEIIKALECCTGYPSCPTNCPLYEQPVYCLFKLSKPALDLIKHQKAEIERLKAELKEDSRAMKQALVLVDEIKKEIAVDIETAKAEAVKEFAERLKAKKHECGCNFRKKPVFAVTEEKIDETYKEMVGEG